jgi:hypothetical protein
LNTLRPATPEEIEKIKATSDLDQTCMVIALDSQKGTSLAVLRVPVEVDPVYFPEGVEPRFKLLFMRDIENFLFGKGVSSFYFNLPASDDFKAYRDAISNPQTFGAVAVSPQPDIRFKKQLQ